MKTPERTVEEMLTEFEEFSVAVFGSYRDEEISWLRKALQAERQKRDEMVKRVWEIVNVRPVTPEGAISKAHLVAELKALTQPNNNK